MEEQAELIKYSAKTKSNLLKQPFVIKMLMKRKEIYIKKETTIRIWKIKKRPLVKLSKLRNKN